MATFIHLFLGQQDGKVVSSEDSNPSKVLWVPDYAGQEALKDCAKAKAPVDAESLRNLANLPYVQRSSRENENGDTILRYDFCEDLMVHQADSEHAVDE